MNVIESFSDGSNERVHKQIVEIEVEAEKRILRLHRETGESHAIPLHGPEITIEDADEEVDQ